MPILVLNTKHACQQKMTSLLRVYFMQFVHGTMVIFRNPYSKRLDVLWVRGSGPPFHRGVV